MPRKRNPATCENIVTAAISPRYNVALIHETMPQHERDDAAVMDREALGAVLDPTTCVALAPRIVDRVFERIRACGWLER
jgi:adenylosuccinate lyase